MPKRDRATWTRVRQCEDCGKTEAVRKDNAATRCKSCASRISGAAGLVTIKARARPKPPRRERHRSAWLNRTCRHCASDFLVRQSALSGKSNATGNFCSRPCYNTWLAQTTIEGGRGRLWKRLARAAVAATPFCGWCGTTKRLHVHHIVPYRLTANNHRSNLIPLCQACHKRIETATKTLERGGGPLETIPAIGTILRYRQAVTAAVLWRIRAEG